MPRMDVISRCAAKNLPVTQEFPGGTWCHSREYFVERYGTGPKRESKPQALDAATRRALEAIYKLTPAEQMLLAAKLNKA